MIAKYFMRFPLQQRIYLSHALLVGLFALATGLAIFGFFPFFAVFCEPIDFLRCPYVDVC